jgi:hypothetical protein
MTTASNHRHTITVESSLADAIATTWPGVIRSARGLKGAE